MSSRKWQMVQGKTKLVARCLKKTKTTRGTAKSGLGTEKVVSNLGGEKNNKRPLRPNRKGITGTIRTKDEPRKADKITRRRNSAGPGSQEE